MPDAIAPPAVRRGDVVAVCAPAGPVPEERLRAGLAVLAPHFSLRVADDITRQTGYLAGSDERRADELNAALRDPDVRCIWAARGGYGIMRILELLDAAALRADPKPIVGFSDVTALLAWAHREGVRPVHGPVLAQLGRLGAEDQRWAIELLTGERGAGELAGGLAACGAPGEAAEGPLVGGNLSLVAHLVGSRWQIDPGGVLVVLEEVGERPYAVDRYLTQLALAGGLAGARAVVCGDFTRCDETRGPARPDALEVVGERLASAGVPGWLGLPVGHGERNRAWPYGARAVIEGGVLRLLEGAVS